jgi:hypothetical protein
VPDDSILIQPDAGRPDLHISRSNLLVCNAFCDWSWLV